MRVQDHDSTNTGKDTMSKQNETKAREQACEIVRSLLETHWAKIQEEWREFNREPISIPMTLKLGVTKYGREHFSATISYGIKTKDSAECLLSDGNQKEMKLLEKTEAQ